VGAEPGEGLQQELLVRDRVTHLKGGVPCGEHREVVVVEVVDRLRVVDLELVVGNLVDPGVDDLPEQLTPSLAPERLRDDANRLGRFDEAEGHADPVSL
jgi:hypothetical protein